MNRISNKHRKSGILLHPTSLPSRYGIGEIGVEAHQWLEYLAAMGQRIWQVLPLGPTSYGDSPYQCLSSFAGNPLLISLESLKEDGLLSQEDLDRFPAFSPENVEFGPVIELKHAALQLAAQNCREKFLQQPAFAREFERYGISNVEWLRDYALYRAIKESQGGLSWTEWPKELASREPEAMQAAMEELRSQVEDFCIIEFLFDRQWNALRKKAKALDIEIIGDAPIFVAQDSADVWANPELFFLDDSGVATVVAGVPPDYFSATGQRWGNPLYDWEKHREDDYAWWKARLRRNFEMVDTVRLDHFRGFAGYWEIQASEETAENGKWVEGPGAHFFQSLEKEFGTLPIIAEDLGIITDDVVALRDDFDLPGMRVMQFAFGADSLAEEYIPSNYPENCVAYTGTHDNDTTFGMFWAEEGEGSTRTQEQIEAERRTILGYTQTNGTEIHWDFIGHLLKSKANTAIFPLQDLLGLGSEARMNAPGIPQGNWSWRVQWDQITPEVQHRIYTLSAESNRLAQVAAPTH